MNILVCVKPVPDPEKYGELRIDQETKRLVREGIPTIINPSDRNALEEALKLREAHGGKVTVLSMAPEFAKDRMLECLAMGADEACLLSDKAFAGADTYVTSLILAKAVERLESLEGAESAGKFDLILMGNESADGATAHVPVQLAEWLGMPRLCRVCSIEDADEGFKVWKKGDEGRMAFAIKMPCLLAVTGDINKPRFVNAMGLIKAKKKPLNIWSNEELGLEAEGLGLDGSPTKAGKLITPDMKRQSQDLGKEPEEIAEAIIGIMKKAGV